MLHHVAPSYDPHIESLLHLLKIVIEQNARLREQIETAKHNHRICTDTLTEIRTPLTVIRTSANIVQRYYDRLTSEKREEHLSNIDSQVAVISTLIEQLGKTNSHQCHANDT